MRTDERSRRLTTIRYRPLRGDVPPTASGRSLRDAVLDSVYHHLLADVPVGRLNDFGALLHEAWMNKKKMATQISDSHIDELYETARKHGAVGGKISGAGGGGYMFFYCNSNRKHILAEQMERMGARWWTLVSTFGDCRRGTRNKQPRHGSCRRDHSRRYPRKHRGQERPFEPARLYHRRPEQAPDRCLTRR